MVSRAARISSSVRAATASRMANWISRYNVALTSLDGQRGLLGIDDARKAVSVTRMPTRSLVRISCAVTSSGCGRKSTLAIRTVRPTAQKAWRPGFRRSTNSPST